MQKTFILKKLPKEADILIVKENVAWKSGRELAIPAFWPFQTGATHRVRPFSNPIERWSQIESSPKLLTKNQD